MCVPSICKFLKVAESWRLEMFANVLSHRRKESFSSNGWLAARLKTACMNDGTLSHWRFIRTCQRAKKVNVAQTQSMNSLPSGILTGSNTLWMVRTSSKQNPYQSFVSLRCSRGSKTHNWLLIYRFPLHVKVPSIRMCICVSGSYDNTSLMVGGLTAVVSRSSIRNIMTSFTHNPSLSLPGSLSLAS